jgi:hypothetical protein
MPYIDVSTLTDAELSFFVEFARVIRFNTKFSNHISPQLYYELIAEYEQRKLAPPAKKQRQNGSRL